MPSDVDGFPDWSGLARHLAPFSGAHAFVIPMTSADGKRALGNNGDRLMHEVFHKLLAATNITETEDSSRADVVIVPPSGSLLEVYHFPDILRERLRPFASIPLVIFPSSALFPRRNPAFIFEDRTASSMWILRDSYSADHLRDQWGNSLASAGVSIELDHDVVASGHEFVQEILGRPSSGGGLLLAGRLDRERADLRSSDASVAEPSLLGIARNSVKRLITYGPVYTAAARFARRDQLDEAGSVLLDSLPPDRAVAVKSARPTRKVDLSAPAYATYSEYLTVLRRSDLVVTNRLHVGLPSAILGKEVVLVEAGYHKLQGVYEQSLVAVPNVTLVGGS